MERQIRPWSDHAINTHKKLLSFNFLDIVLLQVSLGLPLACFSFPFRVASQIPITSSGGSKPLDTEGARSSRPPDKGKARGQKNFFRPFGPQFCLEIGGGGGWGSRAPDLHPRLTSTDVVSKSIHLLYFIAVTTVAVPWFLLLLFFLFTGWGCGPLLSPSPLARLNNG